MKYLAPALTVGDLMKSYHFYREVLGFDEWFKWEDEQNVEGSAGVMRGAARIILDQETKSNRVDGRRGLGVQLYMDVGGEDIDAYHEEIVRNGGNVVGPPKDQPWGSRDFTLTDPDGYKITFAKALSEA